MNIENNEIQRNLLEYIYSKDRLCLCLNFVVKAFYLQLVSADAVLFLYLTYFRGKPKSTQKRDSKCLVTNTSEID